MTDEDNNTVRSFLAQLDKNQALTALALQGVVDDLKEVKETQKATDNRVLALEARRWPANTVSVVMMFIAAAALIAPYIFK
jgi:hypothetical protein